MQNIYPSQPFLWTKRPDDREQFVNVYCSDICKYELHCVDRHAAGIVPNLFFKLKKLQMKHIFDKVMLAIWWCKPKLKQIKVKDVLNDTEKQLLVNLDEGFCIFRTLRNSSAYFDRKKKDAFAMIRQLGFPALFVSQSAAETKWPELLRALGKRR